MSDFWYTIGARMGTRLELQMSIAEYYDDGRGVTVPDTMELAIIKANQEYGSTTPAETQAFYRGWRVGRVRYWMDEARNMIQHMTAAELEAAYHDARALGKKWRESENNDGATE